MKKKDIALAIISVVLITVALYFVVQMLFPPKAPQPIKKESDSIPVISEDIDEETFNIVEELKDYGVPETDNLGKSDLFAD